MSTIRPVINIRRKAPGAKPSKFARVTFPESAGPLDMVAMLTRFPGLGDYVESLLGLPRVVPFRRAA